MRRRRKEIDPCGALTPEEIFASAGKLRPVGRIVEQMVFTVKRAWARGELQPGKSFPSVRKLSRRLGINPNTAHRVVATLVTQGVLIAIPSSGTVVAQRVRRQGKERTELLDHELERMAVEACCCDIPFVEVCAALAAHWRHLQPRTVGLEIMPTQPMGG